jgi:hypothetical protein
LGHHDSQNRFIRGGTCLGYADSPTVRPWLRATRLAMPGEAEAIRKVAILKTSLATGPDRTRGWRKPSYTASNNIQPNLMQTRARVIIS